MKGNLSRVSFAQYKLNKMNLESHSFDSSDVLEIKTKVNVQELVDVVIDDIFREMISMPLDRSTARKALPIVMPAILSCIEFSGFVNGQVQMITSFHFAKEIAAAMMGMSPDEIDQDLASDSIGELTNMLSGNLQSRISDGGHSCTIRPPKVSIISEDKDNLISTAQLGFVRGENALIININLNAN